MKRQSVTAIIIAVLLVFSFLLIRSYRSNNMTAVATTNFSLIGNWKLDSVYATASVPDSLKQLAASLNSDDFKNEANFNFRSDSAVIQFSPADSIAKRYRIINDSIYIDNSSGNAAYVLQQLSDSLVSFRSADSLTFLLRRK